MGRKEQRKGRAAEREICGILNGMGFQVRPGEAVSFGREADIVGLENIHAEIKRREAVDLSAALTQASTDAAYFGGLPAVFHRGNRQKWRVTMTLDSWIALYKWALSGDFGRPRDGNGKKVIRNDGQADSGLDGASIGQNKERGGEGGECF